MGGHKVSTSTLPQIDALRDRPDMAADLFTVRIFVTDGDPEGVRLVDRMNWTGVGVVFPREQ
jgi:hypothetical protein